MGSHRDASVSVPAEVWSEDVNALVLLQQGMESTAIGSIDAVALVRVPEGQLPAKQHIVTNMNISDHQENIYAIKESSYRGFLFGHWLNVEMYAASDVITGGELFYSDKNRMKAVFRFFLASYQNTNFNVNIIISILLTVKCKELFWWWNNFFYLKITVEKSGFPGARSVIRDFLVRQWNGIRKGH